ncbi:MAG: (Fe-S)-binding protein [Thermoanaerobaculia bacterium]|nr:(Fe-S)-binding protein [Thermoanaerobaculia bacterium]
MEFAIWERLLLAVLVVASATLFALTLRPRVQLILAGKSDRPRTDRPLARLGVALKEVLFQTRVIGGRPIAGALHAAVFGGFLFFALETTDHFLKPYGLHFLALLFGAQVPIYKVVLAVWAVAVSIGIVGLAFRRFVLVKISPDPKSYSSGLVALLILLLMLTFLYAQRELPVGIAKANWWLHAAIILVFPHLIIRSKHFHILMAPIAIFFRTERLAELKPLDLDVEALEAAEEVPSFGLEKMADLSWKQRMDFLTCVECKRCTDNCPANLAGQELDPRGFILQGRASILSLGGDEPVIGNVISELALGQCTSCGACEENCPVGVEHLQVLTGAKRAQALSLGTGMVAADFMKTIERSGNPFGQRADARTKLIRELELPIYEAGKTEYLLWLGCVWSYNADARSSLEAMVKILRTAGTSFGVLESESCSGHHSRRQGEEMQFQTLAQENIGALKEAKVAKMISPCPHCLHTIGREYSTLDQSFAVEVQHHSQVIAELQQHGKIRLDPAKHAGTTTTYHDPCYLGRYEKVFDAPREVIRRTGLQVVEMERHRERAVCCGGGNAGFMSQREEKVRVDQVRKGHVKATGANLLVVGCPECKMMLNSAVEETKDLAELVAEAMV